MAKRKSEMNNETGTSSGAARRRGTSSVIDSYQNQLVEQNNRVIRANNDVITKANKTRKPVAMRIKITPMGGYVVGDGKCPFDPDTFLFLFGNKILEAQRAGLDELYLNQEMVDEVIANAKGRWEDMIMNAPTREVLYNPGQDVQQLIAAV